MTANEKLDMFNHALKIWMNKAEVEETINDLRNDWRELRDCTDPFSVDCRRRIEHELNVLGGMGALGSNGIAVRVAN